MKRNFRLFVVLCALSSLAVAHESDIRTVVPLSEPHRAQVLTEMRQFLSGLAEMSAALAKEDMESVARAAHSLGSPMTHHVPADLKQALPEDFRKLGFAVHADFDQIALDAESLGDARHTLAQLGETLSKCVACHNTYQIRAEAGP
jgi:cytochrome c556